MQKRPILGISMGDPFGNGPEITVRALSDAAIYERCRPLVVGDVSSMAYALKVAKKVSGIDLTLNVISDVTEAKFCHGTIDVLDMGLVPAETIPDTSEEAEPKPFKVGACALGRIVRGIEACVVEILDLIDTVVGLSSLDDRVGLIAVRDRVKSSKHRRNGCKRKDDIVDLRALLGSGNNALLLGVGEVGLVARSVRGVSCVGARFGSIRSVPRAVILARKENRHYHGKHQQKRGNFYSNFHNISYC